MANPRRTIRKTDPARTRQLDDQLWPLVVAFFVLGGFLAGTVLAYLRLDDPRWYANAGTYLLAIPLLISVLLLALAWTGNRWLRRSMQLALVSCAIVHLLLLVAAVETDVFRRVWVEVLTATQPRPQQQVERPPQYTSWHHEPRQRVQREFSQPVETETPESLAAPQVRELRREESVEVELRPRTLPATQPVALPDVVRREQVNQELPRQRRQSSELSRRLAEVVPNPTQTVPLPQPLPQPPRPGEVVAPRQADPRRSANAQMAERTASSAPTPANDRAADVRLARRQVESARPAPAASAAVQPRSETRAQLTPRAEIPVADQSALAHRSDPEAPRPNNTLATKQQTQVIERREPAPVPVQVSVNESSRRREFQSPAPTTRSWAQTPRPVDVPRERVTQRPDLTASAEQLAESGLRSEAEQSRPVAQSVAADRGAPRDAVTQSQATQSATPAQAARIAPGRAGRAETVTDRPGSAATTANVAVPSRQSPPSAELGTVAARVSPSTSQASAQEPVEPAPSAVAAVRQPLANSMAGNVADRAQQPSEELAGAAATPQLARRRPRDDSLAKPPAVDVAAAAPQPPRRSTRTAPSLESPRAEENPVAQSHATGGATPAPSALALNKAQTGVAGRGASPNLGLADPAGESPAQVAFGSAQRTRSTQDVPAGPALTPLAAALTRSGRAGQREPSAVLQATPLVPSTLVGSARPESLNASASAALTRAASDAQRGEVTAAKGTVEVDLGPTTRVAEAGSGRAEGGGMPQRSSGSAADALPRATWEQTVSPSLAAETQRADTAAPPAEGTAPPPQVELAENPHAAVTSREGIASIVGGPPAPAGGSVAAPVRSLMPARRRAAVAADGPPLAQSLALDAAAARKSSRDRQLDSPLGAADLPAGNAGQQTDRAVPVAELAARASASTLGKQNGEAVSPPALPADVVGSQEAEPGPSALVLRAEAVAAREGPATLGGGTASLPRASSGPPLALELLAESVQAAGDSSSRGHVDAEPQSSQGTLLTRLAGGLDAPRNAEPVGAQVGELAAEGDASQADSGPARRSSLASSIPGPAAVNQTHASPLVKTTRTRELGNGSDSLAAKTTQSAPAQDEDREPGPLADAPQFDSRSRLAGSALPVTIDVAAGPGGLGAQVTVDVGVADRRAAELSDQVQLNAARFVRRRVGGLPDLDTNASLATEPFRRRERREEGVGSPAMGVGPETEEAIELGLVYLSRTQASDGRWTLDQHARDDGLPQLASDTAATGLALLAFQGAGYSHREYRYAQVVGAGVEFLLGIQKPDGDLYLPMDGESNRIVALYSHSIATLALCEAYGMTQDPELREPAQQALDFVVQAQHESRGGWRYSPRIGSDTSVTGWMMMALKSGELAGLDVPQDTYQRIDTWLDQAQASEAEPHLYCYNPYAPDTPEQRAGRRPSHTMTAVGLLMRLYSGWRRDHPNLQRGADYLLSIPPTTGTSANPQRDTYYWYYATQVMFHMGGQHWQAWNRRLHPLLVGTQVREGELSGSWDPHQPVPDRWAPFAGRLYVTTMNLLSLEVTYRYLPLYDDTAK